MSRPRPLVERCGGFEVHQRHVYRHRIPRGMAVTLLGALPEGAKIKLLQRRVVLLNIPPEWKARIIIGDKNRVLPGDLRVCWLRCASKFLPDARYQFRRLFEAAVWASIAPD